TVSPTIYAPHLARQKLQMQPQPELGQSRAMLAPSAFLRFAHTAMRNPQNSFLVARAGYEADCNLLDDVPKVDGFYSIVPHEWSEVRQLLYGTPNANYPQVEDFLGVSQITATNDIYQWQSRPNFLPLVTAGQKPIYVDHYSLDTPLARLDFDGSKIVFLLEETKSFVTVSKQTSARILNSNFKTQSVDIEAEADEPSLVVVAQTYYHNWRAFVDGNPTPLLQANHAFQAVQIPAGRHRIKLIYCDRAFEIGAVISMATLCGCIIVLILCRKKI
ncbi:MAG TPA: YfhO family protein, partial [Candidatus Baltobacteraceae bacterium]|nr:YfhO family protein [Candidatus Baltobacteraceae bacterium]